jgi:hypothetical protein
VVAHRVGCATAISPDCNVHNRRGNLFDERSDALGGGWLGKRGDNEQRQRYCDWALPQSSVNASHQDTTSSVKPEFGTRGQNPNSYYPAH